MTAPHPHGIAPVDRIRAHAAIAVAQQGRAALNPYEAHTDHHAVWQQAAGEALAERKVEGQGA
jgi:hypothetical protein